MTQTATRPDQDEAAPPREAVVIGHFDEHGRYHVRRSHGAPSWLVAWTTSGAGRFRQGTATVTAAAGDLVLVGPDIEHEYGIDPASGQWNFWWAHLPGRPAWIGWLAPHLVGPRMYAVHTVPGPVARRITAGFRRAHADTRWSGEGSIPAQVPAAAATAAPAVGASQVGRELALSGFETMLILATGAARGGSDLDVRIRRAVALMAADPGAEHSVASLAAAVALSPSRFAHLFSEQTGQTPMQALLEARLQHAAALLYTTDLPVGRIAHGSGFASPYHFSRVFRERYGAPPRSFRRVAGVPAPRPSP
ncbi:MAG TPA: helix-turn-helix domain-containing protein [Mycobacteriales bacterium]|nr:helix-turn-helix domain-containing protein [Mycobacteriales bacterium]